MNVLHEGDEDQAMHNAADAFIRHAFKVEITHDKHKEPQLIIRTHGSIKKHYNCPYILWSGEPSHVSKKNYEPLFEVNTFLSNDPQSVYFPHLVTEIQKTVKQDFAPKKFCCAYAYRNPVFQREILFRSIKQLEPTCYSFGNSCFDPNPPFVLKRESREKNASAFRDFAFMFALENSQRPGYITEKIGNAYCTGAIPIYNANNGVEMFFNRETFFDVSFLTPDKASETIAETWKDPQKLQRFFDAPLRSSDLLEKYEDVFSSKTNLWQSKYISILRDQFPDL